MRAATRRDLPRRCAGHDRAASGPAQSLEFGVVWRLSRCRCSSQPEDREPAMPRLIADRPVLMSAAQPKRSEPDPSWSPHKTAPEADAPWATGRAEP